jgi:hypothetical protein
MPPFPWPRAVLVVVLMSAGVARASGAAGYPPPPPAPLAEARSVFDSARKPPTPVSFLSHEGGWVVFNYPPSARDRIAPLIGRADAWREELAETLGQTPLDGVEVRIARGSEEMATLSPAGAAPGPSDGDGAAYPELKLIVLSLGAASPTSSGELATALRRELARTALDEAVLGRSLPTWFAEGFAVQFAGDGGGRALTLYQAAIRRATVPVDTLDVEGGRGGPHVELARAESADFMRFLVQPSNRVKLAATLAVLRQGRAHEVALAAGYGESLARLEQTWRADLQRRAVIAGAGVLTGVPAALAASWLLIRALVRARRARGVTRKADAAARRRAGQQEGRRVHIVFSRRDDRKEPLRAVPEAEIPRVEHDGEWHTLH